MYLLFPGLSPCTNTQGCIQRISFHPPAADDAAVCGGGNEQKCLSSYIISAFLSFPFRTLRPSDKLS